MDIVVICLHFHRVFNLFVILRLLSLRSRDLDSQSARASFLLASSRPSFGAFRRYTLTCVHAFFFLPTSTEWMKAPIQLFGGKHTHSVSRCVQRACGVPGQRCFSFSLKVAALLFSDEIHGIPQSIKIIRARLLRASRGSGLHLLNSRGRQRSLITLVGLAIRGQASL